ncbi:MAG: peptidoglycan-binding protein [Gaiellaceae bacterium]
MRLRILLAGVAAAAFAVGAPPAFASGGRNPQTAGLQVALRAQGLYRGAIDAISGPGTVAAVRRFQQIHGLRVTGIADARTRRALGPLGRPLFGARTLHRGNFGWDVAVLQFLLLRQGINVPVNAYYDGPTLHGVRLLQHRLHLSRDGVVGPHTLSAIVRREPVPLAHGVQIVAVRHSRAHTHRSHRSHRSLAMHVVRAGESLSSIARRYGTTVAKLARRNHLDPSHVLLIGTKLRIPAASARPQRVKTQQAAYRTQSVASVRALIDYWAAHYGVDVHLVRALAWMESGYNNSLVSSVGARGIMQLLPTTFRFAETVLIGHRVTHNANGNVRAGVAYIAHLLHDFHGNRRLALAGWYQGERAVRKHGLYKETRPFVANVLALAQRM